jgi:hypothetical protein
MRGHSRPKDGVLSHAYDPRIHPKNMNHCKFDGLPGQGPAMTSHVSIKAEMSLEPGPTD